ncbi:DUF932 domain-containing protein [Desulfoferula mesophila]|uniref:DUF932 domain-containing protein n=1 Tax=Desulfoferula mesophila TaxID=3058419 RepID=A0AAU9EBF0_9BACT|nr:hypothetical protein FAK_09180 [Desulfoferula mesophilus]
MKGMTTFGNVQQRAEALAANYYDALVPVKEMEFSDLRTVKIGGEPHHLRRVASQRVAARLGIPHPYLERCPADLQAEQLNYWLREERNEEFFVRFDGADVRAVFTPRYTPADNLEVLSRLVEIGVGTETKVQVALDKEFMSLSIPDQNRTFEVKGDRLTPGISVSNSEVGLASLSVKAFFLRLVCTNGLIAKTEVSSSYRHVSARILEELPQALGQVQGELDSSRDKMRISMSSPVSDPEATLRSFNRQFQLSQREQKAVAWGFVQEPGKTMWEIIQAYTFGSKHSPLTAEESHRLQVVGGMVLGMVQ